MTDREYRQAAKDQYGEEGSIEIDDDADVSRNNDPESKGAYVAAWVWVEEPEAGAPLVDGTP